MIYPSIEEVTDLSNEYNCIPIVYERYADKETPIRLFLKCKSKEEVCFLLESANDEDKRGRYSFIGMRPILDMSIKDGNITLAYQTGEIVKKQGTPIDMVRDIMKQYKAPNRVDIPKLVGGAVGYFAYDSIRYVEKKLNNPSKDDLHLPDAHFLLCQEMIAFDHVSQKIIVIVNISTKGNLQDNYEKGVIRAKELMNDICQEENLSQPKIKTENTMIQTQENTTNQAFLHKVKKAKQYIADGDIFQVVLSKRVAVENPPDAFDTYRALRLMNPSPYMYYFNFKDYEIVGSSPEMLVKVEDGEVVTNPIAGTIQRGRSEREDNLLEKQLLADEKERAEHTMLVDLGRNDLGKVCEMGSVVVTEWMKVERYSKVMHLVSKVKGKLDAEKQSLDALTAVLPAGTLSGAPKIRAMEIIDELEETKRGLYGGSIGYIGFNGTIDMCIAIRTILYKQGKAYVQTGAGIVADSITEKELEEIKNKGLAMMQAIEKAGEIQ